MKALLLSVLVLGGATSAQAATHYESVMAMYDAGTPLALADVDAAYAGRCFYAPTTISDIPDSDDATGALFVGHASIPPASNAGPAFGAPTARYKINIFNANGNVSDIAHYRFDDWTKAQALDVYNGPYATSNYVTANATDLTWHSTYPGNNLESDNSARRSGSYIVVKAMMKNTSGQVQMACYFYKQLK